MNLVIHRPVVLATIYQRGLGSFLYMYAEIVLSIAFSRIRDTEWAELGRVLAQSITQHLVVGLEMLDSLFKRLKLPLLRTN